MRAGFSEEPGPLCLCSAAQITSAEPLCVAPAELLAEAGALVTGAVVMGALAESVVVGLDCDADGDGVSDGGGDEGVDGGVDVDFVGVGEADLVGEGDFDGVLDEPPDPFVPLGLSEGVLPPSGGP